MERYANVGGTVFADTLSAMCKTSSFAHVRDQSVDETMFLHWVLIRVSTLCWHGGVLVSRTQTKKSCMRTVSRKHKESFLKRTVSRLPARLFSRDQNTYFWGINGALEAMDALDVDNLQVHTVFEFWILNDEPVHTSQKFRRVYDE